MVEKRLLLPSRLRCISAGFGWVDRRFLRAGIVRHLDPPSLLLYYFLTTVADAEGLSFWSDPKAAAILHLPVGHLVGARSRLVAHDLVAYREPLYQVLSLPEMDAPNLLPAQAPARRLPEPHRRGATLTGPSLFVRAIAPLRPLGGEGRR